VDSGCVRHSYVRRFERLKGKVADASERTREQLKGLGCRDEVRIYLVAGRNRRFCEIRTLFFGCASNDDIKIGTGLADGLGVVIRIEAMDLVMEDDDVGHSATSPDGYIKNAITERRLFYLFEFFSCRVDRCEMVAGKFSGWALETCRTTRNEDFLFVTIARVEQEVTP